ncbi:MAG: hypothetical protein H0W62_11680 [Chitinophagales bacterium]|nr:hypothetical protein [Chitinophagales bacterium]
MDNHHQRSATILISRNNIDKIETINKPIAGTGVIHIALIKGLESPNLAVYLKEPSTITKAFGIKKVGSILLVKVDKVKNFIEAFEN